MKINNSIIRKEARDALKGNWGVAVGLVFIFQVVGVLLNVVSRLGLKILVWSFLFVIPGVIASMRYSQAIFIKFCQNF